MTGKKRGRGNPKKPFIGPRLPDAGRGDLPNPRAPYCNKIYNEVRGKSSIPMYCGKQGLHIKHGKGKRTRWK